VGALFVTSDALLAVAPWALASDAFAPDLAYFPDYNAVYGSFVAAIALVLYIYVFASALLLGVEVNAATQRPPRGREAGRKPDGLAAIMMLGGRR